MSGSPLIQCRKFSSGPWPGCDFSFWLEDAGEVFPGYGGTGRFSYPPYCPKCRKGVLR